MLGYSELGITLKLLQNTYGRFGSVRVVSRDQVSSDCQRPENPYWLGDNEMQDLFPTQRIPRDVPL